MACGPTPFSAVAKRVKVQGPLLRNRTAKIEHRQHLRRVIDGEGSDDVYPACAILDLKPLVAATAKGNRRCTSRTCRCQQCSESNCVSHSLAPPSYATWACLTQTVMAVPNPVILAATLRKGSDADHLA